MITSDARARSVAGSVAKRRSIGKLTPIRIWAALGAVFVAIIAYGLINWVLSPNFGPAPVGDTPFPRGQYVTLRFFEAVSAILAVGFFIKLTLIPYIKTRTLTWDGLMVMVCFTLLYWDVLDNYVNPLFWYNAYVVNLGSWAPWVPGWGYPNHEQWPEPLLVMGGIYVWFFVGPMILGCKFLNMLHKRFPDSSIFARIFVLFLAQFVVDAVVEGFAVRTSIFAYPGAIRSLSLWPGTPAQFPLYEPFLVGILLTAFACLRYFRDDKGRTFAERGVDQLKLPAAGKTFVRTLALCAASYTIILTVYYVPINLFAINGDAHPPMPSYMRAGVCGAGTDYACPDPEYVPIPRVGGKNFIRPDDPKLPPDVRAAQDGPAYGYFSDGKPLQKAPP